LNQLGGRDDVVVAELGKLRAHALNPLGVAVVLDSLDRANR
jgi:hypothetical protein